jgi:hypothetical protein
MFARLLIVLAALLTSNPAAAAWVSAAGTPTAEQTTTTTYTQTFTTTLGDLTALDVSGCIEAPLVSFDASTGDTSTDAQMNFFSCDTLTATTDHCVPLRVPPNGPALLEYIDYPLGVPGKYLTPRAMRATAGGDTAQVSVRCDTRAEAPVAADAANLDYTPTDEDDWQVVPTTLLEASDELADKKQNVSDVTSVLEASGNPDGVTTVSGPNAFQIDETARTVYASAGGTAWFSVGASANVAQDVDGDTLPDLIYCSDYSDSHGITTGLTGLETADIQLCIEALTDTGPKVVILLPGAYQPPTDPTADYPSVGDAGLVAGVDAALVQITSNTQVTCLAKGLCRIVGMPAAGASANWAVVSNADIIGGNTNVTVSNVEIDGGEGDVAYDPTLITATSRAGLIFEFCTDCEVRDSWIHDTHHACAYIRNWTRNAVIDNKLEDCGGWSQTGTTLSQPALYGFVNGFNSVGFLARGNEILNATASGINTRINEIVNSPTGTIVDFDLIDNDIHDLIASGAPAISLRGVNGGNVKGNNSRDSLGLVLTSGVPGSGQSCAPDCYLSNGNPFANKNLQIDDNHFSQLLSTTTQQGGINIGAYQDDIVLNGNKVTGTNTASSVNTHGVIVESPQRRFHINGLTVTEMFGRGFYQSGASGSRAGTEGWLLENITVDGVDWASKVSGARVAGMYFEGDNDNLTMRNIFLRAATDPELQFVESLTNSVIESLTVDSTNPGYLGSFTEATAPACFTYTSTSLSVSGSANAFTLTNGFSDGTGVNVARAGDYITVSGATNATNNGVFVVTGVTGDDTIAVSNAGLVDETAGASITLKAGRADFWWNVSNSNNDCIRTSGTGATVVNCSCSASNVTGAFSPETQVAVDFQDATPVTSSDVFRNWYIKNVRSNDLIKITDGATPFTNLIFDGIRGDDDAVHTIGSADSDATISFATTATGPGSFTGIQLGGVTCGADMDVADCIEIVETSGDNFFSTEFSFIDHRGTSNLNDELFDGLLCTNANGSSYSQTDGIDDTTFFDCVAGIWVPRANP